MTLSKGCRLGRYEIRGPLGTGGMGEVYRAWDETLAREIAVKVLPAGAAADADRLRRFEQEARAAGGLAHPNVLVVHDFGLHEGSPYLVSERLEGETLRDRLREGALVPRSAAEYAVQVARGLAAAHERGIVHRDLKPENVFLCRDGVAKILDFGIAKLRDARAVGSEDETTSLLTRPGTILGTAAYMSPEQVRGTTVDHRADIFSLGAILYEMLVGRVAFLRGTAAETMAAILKDDPLERPGVAARLSPQLGAILRHCLEKDPGARFQSAQDLAFALAALGDTSTHRPEGSRPPPLALIVLAVWALAATALLARRAFESARPPSWTPVTFRRGSVSTGIFSTDGSARFSPDGRTVFYNAKWGEGWGLYATAVSEPEPREIEPAGRVVGTRAGEIAVLLRRGRTWTLARMPAAGGTPRELVDDVVQADWAANGEFAIVREETGRQRLEFPPGRRVYETGHLIQWVRVSPRGRFVALVEKLRGFMGAWVVLLDGDGKEILRRGPWVISGLAWSPDEQEVWLGTDKEGRGLATWAVTRGGAERLVYRGPENTYVFDRTADGRTLVALGHHRFEMAGAGPGDTRERDLTWLGTSNVTSLSANGRMVLFDDVPFARDPSIFLGRTDGGPPVRLAEGSPGGLSRDGRWALGFSQGAGPQHRLSVIPTGAGESRVLPRGSIDGYQDAFWLPDAKRVLIAGFEKGRPTRLFVQDLAGGLPRAVTPEGIATWNPTATSDGVYVLAGEQTGRSPFRLYPIEGGEPRPVPGLREEDVPLGFDGDGRFVFVQEPTPENDRARIARLDVRTGRREPWKELRPADPAGVGGITFIRLSADGRSYVYSYARDSTTLYVAAGLR